MLDEMIVKHTEVALIPLVHGTYTDLIILDEYSEKEVAYHHL